MPRTINEAIEAVKIDRLKPHPRNVNQGDFVAIQQSVETNGFYGTIVANKRTGHILAGNHRWQVAKAMHYDTVPVAWVDVDDEQELRILIADNRTTRLGIDNEVSLTELLAELAATPTGLTGTGFDGDDLDALISSVTGADKAELLTDPDEVPEDAPTRCNPGDLWVLGDHRLLCGDSTKAEDVERLMAGAKADLCLTDPPYGADIQYATYNDTQDALVGLIKDFFPLAQKYSKLIGLTPGINNVFLYEKPDWILCWFYAAGTGRTPWGFSAWQPVIVWGKDPKLANGEGAHPDGYNWPMSKADAEERKTIAHACPKPVSSWAKWIERLSNEKTETLYEPFCGSGTTLIAAEQLGRKCYGMEISPKYCDVIIERWERATGRTAVLLEAGNGTTD